MKVGDLVRLKNPLFRASIGLIVDIDHHPRNAAPVQVQWFGAKYSECCNPNELEVIARS